MLVFYDFAEANIGRCMCIYVLLDKILSGSLTKLSFLAIFFDFLRLN